MLPVATPRLKPARLERYGKFFWELMNRGVYLAPSAFEVGFILSRAHKRRPPVYRIRHRCCFHRTDRIKKGLIEPLFRISPVQRLV